MGSASSIGSAVSGVLGGGLPFLDPATKAPGVPASGGNTQLGILQDAQAKNATQFRSSLPSLQAQGQAQIQNEAGVGLNNQLKNNSRAASSRGLLYSGLKQQADSTAGTQTASKVANDTANLNAGLNSQANQMDSQALNNAVQLGNLNSQANWNAYQMALAQKQAQNAAGSAVLSGAGGVLGTFGGSAAAMA